MREEKLFKERYLRDAWRNHSDMGARWGKLFLFPFLNGLQFAPHSLLRMMGETGSQNCIKETWEKGIQVFTAERDETVCSLYACAGNARFAQNPKMMRQAGFGDVDSKSSARFLHPFG
jgi:hypothetical protein